VDTTASPRKELHPFQPEKGEGRGGVSEKGGPDSRKEGESVRWKGKKRVWLPGATAHFSRVVGGGEGGRVPWGKEEGNRTRKESKVSCVKAGGRTMIILLGTKKG